MAAVTPLLRYPLRRRLRVLLTTGYFLDLQSVLTKTTQMNKAKLNPPDTQHQLLCIN